ncbi:hypothetical protein GCM10023080_078540 [Streptomyces pseudoechinosporeus]
MPIVRRLDFLPTPAAVSEPCTKLGGQPVWLDTPQWPLSARSGAAMRFLAQFRIDQATGAGATTMAYLFMADDPDRTWEPEGGENALLIQPGGRLPGFLQICRAATGPALDGEFIAGPPAGTTDENLHQFLGGPGVAPRWLQGDERPGPGWWLLAQLDSGSGAQPVRQLSFGGDGVGYAFVSPDGREGRFLWQCT